jgi:hypothetical protein
MAVQMINVGRLANDGTGDDLREAFIKINQNFQLFDAVSNPQGRNLGSEGAEVFAQVENGEFQFRRLVPGQNIQINQFDNTIQINSTAAAQSTNFQIVGDNSNTLVVVDSIVLRMQGDGNIITEASENTKTVNFKLSDTISKYFEFDFGEIDSTQNSIFEFVMNSIGVDMGTFTNPNTLSIDEGSSV